MGLFTASGLVAAVAVTRFWLPHLMPDLAGTDPGESEAPAKPNLNMAVLSLLLKDKVSPRTLLDSPEESPTEFCWSLTINIRR